MQTSLLPVLPGAAHAAAQSIAKRCGAQGAAAGLGGEQGNPNSTECSVSAAECGASVAELSSAAPCPTNPGLVGFSDGGLLSARPPSPLWCGTHDRSNLNAGQLEQPPVAASAWWVIALSAMGLPLLTRPNQRTLWHCLPPQLRRFAIRMVQRGIA